MPLASSSPLQFDAIRNFQSAVSHLSQDQRAIGTGTPFSVAGGPLHTLQWTEDYGDYVVTLFDGKGAADRAVEAALRDALPPLVLRGAISLECNEVLCGTARQSKKNEVAEHAASGGLVTGQDRASGSEILAALRWTADGRNANWVDVPSGRGPAHALKRLWSSVSGSGQRSPALIALERSLPADTVAAPRRAELDNVGELRSFFRQVGNGEAIRNDPKIGNVPQSMEDWLDRAERDIKAGRFSAEGRRLLTKLNDWKANICQHQSQNITPAHLYSLRETWLERDNRGRWA